MQSLQYIVRVLENVLEKVNRRVNTGKDSEDPTDLSLAVQAFEIDSTIWFSVGGTRACS